MKKKIWKASYEELVIELLSVFVSLDWYVYSIESKCVADVKNV